MIQEREKTQVTTNINSEGKTFGIAINSKVFNILSSNIYKDKIMAPIRELICNAYDAQKEVGKGNEPIHIYCPSIYDPKFYVRDFGTGMDEETIMELYTSYGASTKDGTNDFVGYFGIGSKSPFAYTTNYTITNYTGKSKQVYVISMEDDLPTIRKVYDEEDSEPAGFKVEIAVKNSQDVQSFRDKIFNFAKTSRANLHIVSSDSLEENKTSFRDFSEFKSSITEAGNLRFSSHEDAPKYYVNSSSINVECGGVIYNYSEGYEANTALANATSLIYELGSQYKCCYVSVPIGSVDITASREELELTEKTKASVSKAIEESLPILIQSVENDLEDKFNKCGREVNTNDFLEEFRKYYRLLVSTYTGVIPNHLSKNSNITGILEAIDIIMKLKYDPDTCENPIEDRPGSYMSPVDMFDYLGEDSSARVFFDSYIETNPLVMEIVLSANRPVTKPDSLEKVQGISSSYSSLKGWVKSGSNIFNYYPDYHHDLINLVQKYRYQHANGFVIFEVNADEVSVEVAKKYINFSKKYGKDSSFQVNNGVITPSSNITDELRDYLTKFTKTQIINITEDILKTKTEHTKVRKLSKRKEKYTVYVPQVKEVGSGRYQKTLKKDKEVDGSYSKTSYTSNTNKPIYIFIKSGTYKDCNYTEQIIEYCENLFANPILLTNNPNKVGIDLDEIITAIKDIDQYESFMLRYELSSDNRLLPTNQSIKDVVDSLDDDDGFKFYLEFLNSMPLDYMQSYFKPLSDLGLKIVDEYEHLTAATVFFTNCMKLLKAVNSTGNPQYYGKRCSIRHDTFEDLLNMPFKITHLHELSDKDKDLILEKFKKVADFSNQWNTIFDMTLKYLSKDKYDDIKKQIIESYF